MSAHRENARYGLITNPVLFVYYFDVLAPIHSRESINEQEM